MNNRELEGELIRFGAPTLAGLKSASLFQYIFSDGMNIQQSINVLNFQLNSRDVYIEVMQVNEKSALLYVYRKKKLAADLKNPKATRLLKSYGYKSNDVDENIAFLKKKLERHSCFPHEIGLFLGYPPEDVQGFIENEGKNCKYCGLWKVYSNETEARNLFAKFKRSTDTYVHVFSMGRSIEQLTVCV